MSAKKLSNGTLSLRFMQKAQLAQNQKATRLVKAEVKDSEEWSIPKDIQDSWNATHSFSSSSDKVTHESSYIPFIFSIESESGESSTKLNGRRVFKRGAEVVKNTAAAATEEIPTTIPEEPSIPTSDDPLACPDKPLSKFSSVISPKPKKSKDASGKTAKQSLFEPTNVGTDMRPQPTPQVFMKPAGIDDPRASLSDSQILQGTPERKKRLNEDSSASTSTSRRKRKKTDK